MKLVIATLAAAITLAGCANANAPIDPNTGKPDPSATHTPGLGNWDQLSAPEKVVRGILAIPIIAVAIPLMVVENAAKDPAVGQAVADTISNTTIYSDTVKTPHGTYDITGSCVYSNCSSTISKRK